MHGHTARALVGRPWWARLLSVIVVIAFTLPGFSARACPSAKAAKCCCCKGEPIGQDDSPLASRVPCCAVDPVATSSPSPVVIDEARVDLVVAASVLAPRVSAATRSPSHVVRTPARARGPPDRVPVYKRTCSYLL